MIHQATAWLERAWQLCCSCLVDEGTVPCLNVQCIVCVCGGGGEVEATLALKYVSES